MSYGDVPASLSTSRTSPKEIRSIYAGEGDLAIEGDSLTQAATVRRRPGADGPFRRSNDDAGEHRRANSMAFWGPVPHHSPPHSFI